MKISAFYEKKHFGNRYLFDMRTLSMIGSARKD